MKKIALFVDVDNLVLSNAAFKEIFEEVNASGRVVYGKVYGVIDRKHKSILDVITNYGYDMAPPMRIKKRGSKVFDHRILVDVMEMVVANDKIDTVAIACAPFDLVPLFAKLREYGVSVMTLDNLDGESRFFVDDFIGGEGSGAASGKKTVRKAAKSVKAVYEEDAQEEAFEDEEAVTEYAEEQTFEEGEDAFEEITSDQEQADQEEIVEEELAEEEIPEDEEELSADEEDEEELSADEEDEDEDFDEEEDEDDEAQAIRMLENVQKVLGGMHFDDDDDE